jgi:hypothetical protein
MLSLFPAHDPADAPFAHELSAFLESGCDDVWVTPDGAIKPGQDLLSTAELGISSDILVLLLSSASNPRNWPRPDVWRPLLLPNPSETDTQVAIFLLEECTFPQLLRRGFRFFDATTGRIPALRRLKRWLRGVQLGTSPAMAFSSDLDDLYRILADQPGRSTASGAIADRFAREATHDFEAVFWIPSSGRTLAQIAGELGSQLKMKLEGPVEDNCRRIKSVLAAMRCLLVLDAPQVAVESLLRSGRTSVLFTSEPVHVVTDAPSLAAARALLSDGRFAEAYELFYQLLESGPDPEPCARGLIWICERWDRVDEANTLRFHLGPSPSEQLRLF